MADANSSIQLVISSATIFGAVAWLLHNLWNDYKETKRKLEEKISKSDCKEFRNYESEEMKDIKESLTRNWEDHK